MTGRTAWVGKKKRIKHIILFEVHENASIGRKSQTGAPENMRGTELLMTNNGGGQPATRAKFLSNR